MYPKAFLRKCHLTKHWRTHILLPLLQERPFNVFSVRLAQFGNLFHGSIVYFEHLLIFGSLYFDTAFQHLWSLVLISQQHLSSHFSTVIGNDEFKNIWHLFSLNFQKWLTWPNLIITNVPTETSVSTVGTLYSYWVFENCGTDNNMATDTLVCHRTRVFTQTGKTGTRKHSDRHFYFCLIHIQRKCRLSFHCNTCRSVLRDFSWLLFASTRNYFCQHQ